MTERILFLTGSLASARLEKVLACAGDLGFEWSICNIGVKVAALMTEAIIFRRLARPVNADRVILPGRCRADIQRLSTEFDVAFERGPDELKDLPGFFGRRSRKIDLSLHDMRIFSEIVDAPTLTVDQIVTRANAMRVAGADVIDIGCLPDTPFPHLEDAVKTLRASGLSVSIDSSQTDELRRGGLAGANYLLSLTADTLDIAAETGAVAVIIPAPYGDMESLLRAAQAAEQRGIDAILDPVLDPIHFGFTNSITRYARLRRDLPNAEILMGTGNLTELTDADSSGVTAMLLGICSELHVGNLLVVQVSPHTRRTIQEHDAARRMMFAARGDQNLPRDYSNALLQIHERRPFPNTPREIADLAARIKDDNFRIEVAEDGVHIYSRRGHHVSQNAWSLFPHLDVERNGAHAFYLGGELMKAEIAFRLGKRYAQDAPLNWGAATDAQSADTSEQTTVDLHQKFFASES